MTGAALVSVAAAVGAALAYGVATAGQHAAAYQGKVDGAGLARLLRDSRWLLATAGDLVGVVLQVLALSYGAVVIVQPIMVLALPVAVLMRPYFKAAPPSRRELGDCALLVAGLAIFLVAVGELARGRTLSAAGAAATLAVVLIVGLTVIVATRRCRPQTRAVAIGAVAGSWFGVVSVLTEAVSATWQHGLRGFGRPDGWVPAAALAALAISGYLLIQVGFQVGPLAASFATNLLLAPVVAVLLGVLLLGETLPTGPVRYLAYLVALVTVSWAVIRLSQPSGAPGPQHAAARPEGAPAHG